MRKILEYRGKILEYGWKVGIKLKKIGLHADLGTFMVFPFRKLEFRKKYLEFSKKILEFSEELEFILQ